MRRLLLEPIFVLALVLSLGIGALAATTPAAAQSLDDIAQEIDQSGAFSQFSTDAEIEAAISRANSAGIGFVWLDQEGGEDTRNVALGLLERLDDLGSRFNTIIVLDNTGVWVEGQIVDPSAAADASIAQFGSGQVAAGINTVVDGVTGDGAAASSGATTGTDSGSSASSATTTTSESSGGGVPWLGFLLLAVVAFFGIRWFTGRRRRQAALAETIAQDKAEIREQLRENADAVIDLGDRVVTADDELRRLYEQASRSYQDVSMGIDDADTVEEIDALDDKIDEAEWQFQVIEARLDGRPAPERPARDDAPPPPVAPPQPPAGSTPPPPSARPDGRTPVPPLGGGGRTRGDEPALGPNESILGSDGSRPSTRTTPRSRSRRSRRGGGLGGMFGGMAKAGLGAMLMRLLLGGGLGGLNTSRRSRRRTSSGSRGRGGGFGGGLGGGVLGR